MQCPNCRAELQRRTPFCPTCGYNLDPRQQGDATGGIIPYKNPLALISYYMGIGALVPFLGVIPALVAVILGYFGLKAHAQNPVIRGQVHAWIGISLGTLFGGLWVALVLLAIFAGR